MSCLVVAAIAAFKLHYCFIVAYPLPTALSPALGTLGNGSHGEPIGELALTRSVRVPVTPELPWLLSYRSSSLYLSIDTDLFQCLNQRLCAKRFAVRDRSHHFLQMGENQTSTRQIDARYLRRLQC